MKVTLLYAHAGHRAGSSIDVDAFEGQRLVTAGVAQPATKPDAKAAGLDPDTAATAKPAK